MAEFGAVVLGGGFTLAIAGYAALLSSDMKAGFPTVRCVRIKTGERG